ncbi:unnamed protein product [Cyprideis torosa]|uniref:Uncharacterized protein n=1 Tax=Cyprideis torosa TaxID=163714 RepID=A0A7R8ZGZ6_9CRUS|nr:unnamed protein product [Cyprideis torosa]CAG0882534.1 unnamed protein product [Cyprideis torosa]
MMEANIPAEKEAPEPHSSEPAQPGSTTDEQAVPSAQPGSTTDEQADQEDNPQPAPPESESESRVPSSASSDAGAKGVSQTVVSAMFSSYAFAAFLAAPIFGRFVGEKGIKYLLIVGGTVAGIACIGFGFLYLLSSTTVFIALCFTVRVINALGYAAYSTAIFSYLSIKYPTHLSTLMGLMAVVIGVGLSLGPAIGGGFFQAGGFGPPFYFLGLLLLATTMITFHLVPEDLNSADTTTMSEASTSSRRLLPQILNQTYATFVLIGLFFGSIAFTVFLPTLQGHLSAIGLATGTTGELFLLDMVCIAISGLAVGWTADKIPKYRAQIMAVGFVGLAAAFFINGPSTNSVWTNAISLTIHGLMAPLVLVPSFSLLHMTAHDDAGLPQNVKTAGAVAGLWNSVLSLGQTCGPLLSGGPSQYFGFSWTMTVIAIVYLTIGLLYSLFDVAWRHRRGRHTRGRSGDPEESLSSIIAPLLAKTPVPVAPSPQKSDYGTMSTTT